HGIVALGPRSALGATLATRCTLAARLLLGTLAPGMLLAAPALLFTTIATGLLLAARGTLATRLLLAARRTLGTSFGTLAFGACGLRRRSDRLGGLAQPSEQAIEQAGPLDGGRAIRHRRHGSALRRGHGLRRYRRRVRGLDALHQRLGTRRARLGVHLRDRD